MIAWVGADSRAATGVLAGDADEVDLGGALLTPGLIDRTRISSTAATALPNSSSGCRGRATRRLHGRRRIRSTVAATRAATDAELFAGAAAGPGADGGGRDDDRGQVRLRPHANMRRAVSLCAAAGRELELGCHDLACRTCATRPTRTEADAYIDAVCGWLPEQAADGLVDAVDAFCETIAFSPASSAGLRGGRTLGLPVKLHAEQLSNLHGAALAAEFGALSCDHLEYLDDEGIAAMAAAGHRRDAASRRVLLLRETQLPPVEAAVCGRADRDRDGSQSGLVAGALAAADDEHGVHAVSAHPGGGIRRGDRERCAGARAPRPRPVGRRAARRSCGLGRRASAGARLSLRRQSLSGPGRRWARGMTSQLERTQARRARPFCDAPSGRSSTGGLSEQAAVG